MAGMKITYRRLPDVLPRMDARYWEHILKAGPDECWPWTAFCDDLGTGRVSVYGRLFPAHFVAWRLTHGPFPLLRFPVHTCATPNCCNPAHLRLGTAGEFDGERMRLRKAGNRLFATLDEQAKLEIRTKFVHGGYDLRKEASARGVNVGSIRRVINEPRWMFSREYQARMEAQRLLWEIG